MPGETYFCTETYLCTEKHIEEGKNITFDELLCNLNVTEEIFFVLQLYS